MSSMLVKSSGLIKRVFGNKGQLLTLSRCLFSRVMSSFSDDKTLLAGLDRTQVDLLKEECIVIDNQDRRLGGASKKECHLWSNIENGLLHRAFSVFLFNGKNELLLQQRADTKITFPGHYTNTCCSHPLNHELEFNEVDATGVKIAAQRKLKHELGIEPEQVSLEKFQYITRIHYKSQNVPDERWGEHEIDYILFIKTDHVDLNPNLNEVKSCKYINQEQLKSFIAEAKQNGTLITPWFDLICRNDLFDWWNNIDNLSQFEDHVNIYKYN